MENKYKYLGVNDDRDYCECCGKSDLKKVVWLEHLESGSVGHYGTTCGSKLLGSKDQKKVKNSLSVVGRLEKYLSCGRMDLVWGYRSYVKECGLTKYVELCKEYEKELLKP